MSESRLPNCNPETKEIRGYLADHMDVQRKEITEPAIELPKKMLIHISSKELRMVRHYGFSIIQNAKKILDRINEAFGEENRTF